jgi:arylsulfatase A-like enzyme
MKQVLLSLACALLTHATEAAEPPSGSPHPAQVGPNIVLLMGDDHGWDETGYNGHPYLQTPALDEMAATGLQLDNFYAAHPSCSPTRCSVLTGRHPNRCGVFAPGWSIRPEEITVAQLLRHAGYRCAHFGKWHLGPVNASSPTNPGAMGFDYWLSHDNFFELNPMLSRNGGPPEKLEGEGSEILVSEAIKYLSEDSNQRQPFFLVIWYGSPHEPYSGLPEDLVKYDQVPEHFQGRSIQLTSNDIGEQVERPLGEALRERYAEITAMDRSIGQLRTWLADNGLRDNTLLWYCGDNGSWSDGAVTSPFRGQKGTVYEGGVHVPGVIEWPSRISEHRIVGMNCVTSDILPTLCELVNVHLPKRPIDGESLVAMFDSPGAARHSPICFWNFPTGSGVLQGLEPYIVPKLQVGTTPLVKKSGTRFTRNFRSVRVAHVDDRYYGGNRAILDGKYKLVVRGGRQRLETQLFDLEVDPAEKVDIAAQQPEVVAHLKGRLLGWQTSVLSSLTAKDY